MNESYIDATEAHGLIHCWTRDEQGTLKHTQVDSGDYSYLFIPANDGTDQYKNIFGVPMKRVDFKSPHDMRQYAIERDGVCESDVKPSFKYLLDNFSKAPTDAPYNALAYDIEVDFDLSDGKGYPMPTDPFGEINSFSCFDHSRETYVMFIPDKHQGNVKLNDEDYPVEIHWVASERDMLMAFASYIEHIDILYGWNTSSYDLPYIMERAIYHFDNDALTMFCRNGLKARKRDYTDKFGNDIWTWVLAGRCHLDMMELYKKFVPGEKPSFSLNAIAELELEMEKIEYDGDLGELYRENPQKFYEYSLHDSRLLLLLENKKEIIRMAMTYARDSCVLPTDATGSVKPIDHGFIKFCREKGNIVVPDKTEHEKEKFDGAIVYDTLEGRHGYLFTIDLTALYPSVMIMLGLSPETLLMQCRGEVDDYVAIVSRHDKEISVFVEGTNELVKLPAWEMDDIIRDNGYTISASGTIFDGSLGLLSEFTKNGFDLRVEQKEIMAKAYKEGNKARGDLYNLLQSVTKIKNNSIYGCCGNLHFRLFDIRMAKSITLTGQIVSKHQAFKTNDVINEICA